MLLTKQQQLVDDGAAAASWRRVGRSEASREVVEGVLHDCESLDVELWASAARGAVVRLLNRLLLA